MSSGIEPTILPTPAEIALNDGLGRRVAKSAAWMILKRVLFRALGIVSVLILARLLAPDAVGLMALGSMAYDILATLAEFSFVLALVKMKKPRREDFDTAWTLIVARGFMLGALMFFGAPLLADIMREPRIVDITRVLALMPIVQSFENVGLIQFRRDLRFDKLFWYEVIGQLSGFLLVIPAAFLLHSAWALVISNLGRTCIMVPVSYILYPRKPRFSLKAVRELFDFSKWLFATNILSVMSSYLMNILVGRVGGTVALGLYTQALQIAVLPVSEIAAPIRQPMYSGYAKVWEDSQRLCRQVVDGLALTMMMIMPMSVGIALTARLIQAVALGPKWLGAAPLIQACALCALFEAVGEFTHNVYIVRDRQRRFVEIMAVTMLIRVGLVIWAGVSYGVLAAAVALAVSAFLNSALWLEQLSRMIDLSFSDVARATWRTGAATLAMIVGVLTLKWAWPQGTAFQVMAMQLACQVLLGAAVYACVLLILWLASGRPKGPERHAVDTMLQLWKRFARN